MEDRCVCCGQVVPEGYMVCLNCSYAIREQAKLKDFVNSLDKSQVKKLKDIIKGVY